jgi:hypothetical protein
MRGENEYYAKGLAPDMTGVDNDRNFFDFPQLFPTFHSPMHSTAHSTIELFEDRASYAVVCHPARSQGSYVRRSSASSTLMHVCD